MNSRLRIIFQLLFAILLILPAAAQQAQRPMEINDLFRIKRVGDPQPSPDGKWIAFVITVVEKEANKTNSDIWLIPSDGGEMRQLTNSPKHDRHPRWSPDGRWIAFESTRDGSSQIYLVHPDGSGLKQLTTLSTEASQGCWSPDGSEIAFVSSVFPEFSEKPFPESDALNKAKQALLDTGKVKARIITSLLYRHWDSWVDGKRQHLFLVPAAGGDPKDVTPGDRDAVPTSSTFSAGDDFDFSPDGSELAYTATPVPVREQAWSTNHDILVLNLKTGERKTLTTNPAADGFPRYSPDGKYMAWRAQSRTGFEADRWQLILMDRSSGKLKSLTENFDAGIEEFCWSPDGKKLYFTAEEKAAIPIWSVSVKGGDVKKVYDGAVNGEVAVAGNGSLCFTHQTMMRPNEIFHAGANGKNPGVLTHVNDSLFSQLAESQVEQKYFTGAAGAQVQMWIVKPPDFNPAKKYPLVFWVHGGPQGAWLDAMSLRWNARLWASQGYVLALPNPRGSTGFGQKFVDEITRDWGGKVFDDLMAGLDVVEQLPYIDTTRMAAAGASYGGYMMNWFQGHTKKFKTIVTHCGTFNFWNSYGATEEVWFDEWEHGIPWETPDFDKFSPHKYEANFSTPNLIIHNERDFRIPYNDGLNLFTVLQRKGIPSKLLTFPDEGHWVLKPLNSELWHNTVFDWLADYLKK
jgi:dipeptidyl aminopeptidase/acylaminoacyl peptidase